MSDNSLVSLKDIFKYLYDLFKHITTLDTGAIVVLATFFSKNFDTTSKNRLVVLCVIAFIFSLLICVVGMFSVIANMVAVAAPDVEEKEFKKMFRLSLLLFVLSTVFFIVGIISLGLFVGANVKI